MPLVLEILGMACLAAAALQFNLLLGLTVTGLLLWMLAARIEGASWSQMWSVVKSSGVKARRHLPKRKPRAPKEAKTKDIVALALARAVLDSDR